MKYKIGDKVEIIKLDDDSAVVKIGDIGIIDGIYDKGDYKIRVNINGVKDYGFNEDEIKLVSDLTEEVTMNRHEIDFLIMLVEKNIEVYEERYKDRMHETAIGKPVKGIIDGNISLIEKLNILKRNLIIN